MCGIIGAEIDGIPEAIAKEVKEFFSSNHDWLKRVFEFSGERPAAAARKARLFLSALEGAMLIARAGGEHRDFAEVAETALALCEPNAERARR
jgi:TetR/AcrR family transcriptional repressor of nem operon